MIKQVKKENGGEAFGDYGGAIKIRRDQLFETAFHQIYEKKKDLLQVLRIQFIDEYN